MLKLFTQHPASVNETYTEHMGSAFSFGSTMVVAGCACLLHGVFPFLFDKTGRTAVAKLYDRMISHRIQTADGDRISIDSATSPPLAGADLEPAE
ncbi:MAG: DUF6356 family protein, partial [Pseudomonadota bacterium]